MRQLSAAVLILLFAFAGYGAPRIRNPATIPIPIPAVDLALPGDFDGDGYEDLLMGDSGASAAVIAVMLSDGAGPLAAAALTNLPYGISSGATGDLDGDGKIDLVFRSTPTTVMVLQGHGDGTFASGLPFTTDTDGRLALGDFNGDTRLDLAISSGDVHFGDGAGHFSGRVSTALGISAQQFIAAELNGDGRADLIATTTTQTLALVNNGNGTFTSKPYPRSGTIAVADFNHDGRTDAAMLPSTNVRYVETMFGAADGSLTYAARYVVGYDSGAIAIHDLDADGHVDLLVGGGKGGVVGALRGTAAGGFNPAQFFVAGGEGKSDLFAGDFDHDGKADFIILPAGAEAAAFVPGRGDGSFNAYRTTHTRPTTALGARAIQRPGSVVMDMNGDGALDVVVLQSRTDLAGRFHLAVLLNDGSGNLAPPLLSDLGPGVTPGAEGPYLAVGDRNKDGVPDAIVLAHAGDTYSIGINSYRGIGDGRFREGGPMHLYAIGPAVHGYFDGDTHLDLFVAHHGSSASVYLGDSYGGLSGPVCCSQPEANNVVTGDFNADGTLDYLSAWSHGEVVFGLNNGRGSFLHRPPFLNVGHPAIGDFNGDGRLDFVGPTWNQQLGKFTGLEVRLGNGDGTFAAPVRSELRLPAVLFVDPLAKVAATGDIDGDGFDDVAYGTSIYFSDGQGAFRSSSVFPAHSETTAAFADMDGNGSLDLVVTKTAADNVDVLLTRTGDEPELPTAIALTSETATPEHGKDVLLTATVTGGARLLTGVVRFEIDGRSVALVELDRTGTAQYLAAFEQGSHVVTAAYTGDDHYQPSASSALSIVAVMNRSVISIRAYSPSTTTRVQVWVEIANGIYRATAPAGTFTFREGSTTLLTLPAPQGGGYLELPIGIHVITVDYTGDANYEPASVSFTQEVVRGIPELQLSYPSTYTADTAITVGAGARTLTGTMSFYADGVLVKTAPLVDGFAAATVTLSWGLHYVRMVYSGDATWQPAERTAAVIGFLVRGSAPAVIATAGSNGVVTIRWSPVTDASSYYLYVKKSAAGTWEKVSAAGYTGWNTTTTVAMPVSTTWLFAVTAMVWPGESPLGPPDLATTFSFVERIARRNPVKAQHLTELRTAIALVRTFAGLPAFSYTNTIAPGTVIRAADIAEMRTALTQARDAIGLPLTFTDPVLTTRTSVIRAVHLNDLRAGAS